MANNELFYQVAREALNDDCSIACLIIDLDTAVASYLQEAEEMVAEGEMDQARLREEIEHGLIHLAPFERNLRGWKELAEPEEGTDDH